MAWLWIDLTYSMTWVFNSAKYVCMYVCTKIHPWAEHPSIAARVQWNPCTLPIRINGDVSLTYIQPTTRTIPNRTQRECKEIQGSLLLCWRKTMNSGKTTRLLGGIRQTEEISTNWSPGQSRGPLWPTEAIKVPILV